MTEKKEIISAQRRTGDLQNMGKILSPLTRRMLGKRAFAEADVICNWAEIAGAELASFSVPAKIDFKKGERTNGVLWIEVAGGAFALEVSLKSKMLIEKVNTFFGYDAVKSLKIVQNPAVGVKMKQDIHNPEKILVTKEEETYIESLSGDMQNPELGEALLRLGCAVMANNKK